MALMTMLMAALVAMTSMLALVDAGTSADIPKSEATTQLNPATSLDEGMCEIYHYQYIQFNNS